MADFSKITEYIDQNVPAYIERLAEVVAIPSISGNAKYRKHVFEMGDWLYNEMCRLKVFAEKRALGKQILADQEIDLPPIILGKYGSDAAKKTILVYGHYDVQPALKTDGWDTDPFTLVESPDGRLIGRGSTDDKGPVISWLWVIEAHQKLGIQLPVNLVMCFEGMEESGSEGLDELIIQEAKGYFAGVDCVCISDNYWLSNSKPCLTYGLRGISYFTIEVSGPAKDLHSGVFGGTVMEPMTDLVALMSRLVKTDGTILVPGIMDSVAAFTDRELALYDALEFKLDDLHGAVGAKILIHNNEKDALMHRWRFPSLSLHGIQGAFSEPGAKTVIPSKVIGKFSIRTVPNQLPEEITVLVKKYLEDEFYALGTKNKLKLDCIHGGKCWVSDINHYSYEAASRATQLVYGVVPDYTREGGSIPVTLTFQEVLGKNVLLLPMGRSDDGAHSINEKLDKSNYIQGIKLLAAYLHEMGK